MYENVFTDEEWGAPLSDKRKAEIAPRVADDDVLLDHLDTQEWAEWAERPIDTDEQRFRAALAAWQAAERRKIVTEGDSEMPRITDTGAFVVVVAMAILVVLLGLMLAVLP